ncbi:TadE/TadG family type IV pilus assembly protein [Maricaulis sp.]|uniref:TadE/TadG family type IV pilus assembly protein n=1 Tax=Maricaulis sp. TaxID=1486257 RepID=UPI002605F689|nr:TadE/TadG family type IV pilus assembly protein [Maricaulis sp.]
MNSSGPADQSGFWRRFRRSEDGAGALEFALVSPALIFLIIGVIQVSLALYKGSTVQWASERALRSAMIGEATTPAAMQTQLQAELNAVDPDLEVEVGYWVDESGELPVARMTVYYSYPIVLPMVETFQARFKIESVAPLVE